MFKRKDKELLTSAQRKEQREEEKLRIDRLALGVSAVSSTASAISALAALGLIASMDTKSRKITSINHPYYDMEMYFDKMVKSTKSYIIDRYVNDSKDFILYIITQKDPNISLTEVIPHTRENDTWWYSVTDSIAIPDDNIGVELGYIVKDVYRPNGIYENRMKDGLARYGYFPIRFELVRDIRRLLDPYASDCMFYFVDGYR